MNGACEKCAGLSNFVVGDGDSQNVRLKRAFPDCFSGADNPNCEIRALHYEMDVITSCFTEVQK